MKTNKALTQHIVMLSAILFFLLIVWGITMLISTQSISPDLSKTELIQKVMPFRPIFVITYLNATLLTIVAFLLFYKLLLFFKEQIKVFYYLALGLTAVYALMNGFVYLSQVTILPQLIKRLFEENISAKGINEVYAWIQLAPHTFISTVNAWAYAVLATPSVILGVSLLKMKSFGTYAGYLLMANALLCIVGIIGWNTDFAWMETGIVLGGILFSLAIPFIFLTFRTKLNTSR